MITTQDVYNRLDDEHCDFCLTMATGLQPWWSDPNTVQGLTQLAAIEQHWNNGKD